MEEQKSFLISVVIPTYNREELLKKAVGSVLSQSYQNFEILIIDDHSIDNTKAAVESFRDERIRYICHKKNLGAAAARNTGIKSAKGEWIAFLDADDVWLEKKLEKQACAISELTDDYAVVHCGLHYIDFSDGKVLNTRVSRGDINEIVKFNIGIIPQTSTMIIRKKVLEELGGFDESLPAHQEPELGLRIAVKYKFKLIDEILVHVRRNHNQITGNPALYIKAKELIVEKHSNILSPQQLYNFHNIIAGNSIVNGNYEKAKKHLKSAIKYRFFSKTILSYVFICISPGITRFFYRMKYKNKGLVN